MSYEFLATFPVRSTMTAEELAARIIGNKDRHESLIDAVTYRYGNPSKTLKADISLIIEDEIWCMIFEHGMLPPTDDVIDSAYQPVIEFAHKLNDERQEMLDAERPKADRFFAEKW